MRRITACLSVVILLSAGIASGQTNGGESVWNNGVMKASGPVWRDATATPAPSSSTKAARASTPGTDSGPRSKATAPAATAAGHDAKAKAPPSTGAAGAGTGTAGAPESTAAGKEPAPNSAATKGSGDSGSQPVAPPRSAPQMAPTSLPPWLTLSAQYRGRVEAFYGASGVPGPFYLNRLRLQSTVTVAPGAQVVLQLQDTRVASYETTAPAAMENVLDVREAYVLLGDPKRNGWNARVGRQELQLGEGRLMTASDWNNTARSFDAARASWTHGNVTAMALMARPVVAMSGAFDRWNGAELATVSMLTWRHKPSATTVEPYVFTKHVEAAAGASAGSALYTYGSRLVGTLPGAIDYNMEVAIQRGHARTERVMASAGHYVLGWSGLPLAWKPRLAADLNLASGDTDPNDGRKETFDQVYGSTHARFGLVDRMAWRNLEHVGILADLAPRKSVKIKGGLHRLFLAEAGDGLYASGSGARSPIRGQVTGSHVGNAVDLLVSVDWTRKTNLSIGAGYLFAGRYLRDALRAGDMWTPHLTWRVLF